LVHFGKLDVWYTAWYTTPVGTLSGFFGTLGLLLAIFGMFGTIFTFGTPVVFRTLRTGSVFSTLDIIPSEFPYIGCTFVHFTLYKL